MKAINNQLKQILENLNSNDSNRKIQVTESQLKYIENTLPGIQYDQMSVSIILDIHLKKIDDFNAYDIQFLQQNNGSNDIDQNQLPYQYKRYEKHDEQTCTIVLPCLYHQEQQGSQTELFLQPDDTLETLIGNIDTKNAQEIKILFPYRITGHFFAIEILINTTKQMCDIISHDNLNSHTIRDSDKKIIEKFVKQKFKIDTVQTQKSSYKTLRSSNQNCGPATILDILSLAQGQEPQQTCHNRDQAIQTRIDHLLALQTHENDPQNSTKGIINVLIKDLLGFNDDYDRQTTQQQKGRKRLQYIIENANKKIAAQVSENIIPIIENQNITKQQSNQSNSPQPINSTPSTQKLGNTINSLHNNKSKNSDIDAYQIITLTIAIAAAITLITTLFIKIDEQIKNTALTISACVLLVALLSLPIYGCVKSKLTDAQTTKHKPDISKS